MIDLTKKSLPNILKIGGKDFSIYTDFRLWLKFIRQTKSLKKGQRMDVSYLFKNEMPTYCDLTSLYEWAFPKQQLPRSIGRESKDIILDYDIDSDLIYAAFLGQYGIDLLKTDMHWYVFQALIRGLNDSTKLREVMGYRAYEKNTDKKSDPYLKLKDAWTIIEESEEEDEELKEFSDLFTKE